MSTGFKELREGVLLRGWLKAGDVPAPVRDAIGAERVAAWFTRLHAPSTLTPDLQRMRLINHFAIGADPELAFVTAEGGLLYPESAFNMGQGTCFGADGCGRIAELRAAPNRSALYVTASLLKAMRMAVHQYPGCSELFWVAYPFAGRDGIGGHIHFGRKRYQARDRDVLALNTLDDVFKALGVFSMQGCLKRAGTYGAKSDVRPQRHGYEYRTFPTWLGSPWQTFLVLTVAKLVVHSGVRLGTVRPADHINTLLAAYKSVDDDALIAHRVLANQGIPIQLYGDIRSAWGIEATQGEKRRWAYLPAIAEPTHNELNELFEHFVKHTALTLRAPEVDNTVLTLPVGFRPLSTWTHTSCTELSAGLAAHLDYPVGLYPVSEYMPRVIVKYHSIAQAWVRRVDAELTKMRGVNHRVMMNNDPDSEAPVTIYTNYSFRHDPHLVAQMRALLTSGLFPIWTIDEVNARRSYELVRAWERAQCGPKSKPFKVLNLNSGRWE